MKIVCHKERKIRYSWKSLVWFYLTSEINHFNPEESISVKCAKSYFQIPLTPTIRSTCFPSLPIILDLRMQHWEPNEIFCHSFHLQVAGCTWRPKGGNSLVIFSPMVRISTQNTLQVEKRDAKIGCREWKVSSFEIKWKISKGTMKKGGIRGSIACNCHHVFIEV